MIVNNYIMLKWKDMSLTLKTININVQFPRNIAS